MENTKRHLIFDVTSTSLFSMQNCTSFINGNQMSVNIDLLICALLIYLFIYLGFYVAFNTVQVISRQVVGRPEETITYSLTGLCTVMCQPMASNYQLSHLRLFWEPNPGLRGGRRECYHSATWPLCAMLRFVP